MNRELIFAIQAWVCDTVHTTREHFSVTLCCMYTCEDFVRFRLLHAKDKIC